ncbi:hypothetical protein BJX99DRAFT_240219 [Aspergillus californicus]
MPQSKIAGPKTNLLNLSIPVLSYAGIVRLISILHTAGSGSGPASASASAWMNTEQWTRVQVGPGVRGGALVDNEDPSGLSRPG